MWRRGSALLAMCAMLTLPPPPCAQAGECLQAGDDGAIAEGRLIERDDALILELPEGACLEGEDDSDNVPASAEIHVYSLDDGVQATLRGLIGKDVHVRGSLMGALTQHHKAPIVMQVREADEI